jgi:hypothetical protein
MSAPFLSCIHWERPWLKPLYSIAQPIVQSADWREALNTAAGSLRNHRGLPIRFVPQAGLPPGVAYEAFISNTGQVPTRENLHDFFNALIWLTFPRIKARLNALQAAEIAKASIEPGNLSSQASTRGKIRDAATIFDENAALLITRNSTLVEALRNHEWASVFLTRREAFLRDCEVRLFGHALLEKLVSPYKAITAHAWIIETDDGFFDMGRTEKQTWIDKLVAGELANGIATSAFTPLPVLGLPGWWGDQDEKYYGDASVFRPKRIAKR